MIYDNVDHDVDSSEWVNDCRIRQIHVDEQIDVIDFSVHAGEKNYLIK